MPNFSFKKDNLISYILIVTGSFIMAVGYVVFLSPLKLAPGGVYGIAIILHHHFNFPIGLAGICLDLPLLLIGTLILGAKFGAKTLIGIVSLSASISLMEYLYKYEPLISDPSTFFVQAVFGGVIIGIGLGMIFKTKATSGGTDIVAIILKRYTHLSLGYSLIIVDSIVVLAALVAFSDWSIPLYSWVVIYVASSIADKIAKGLNPTQTVLIISDKYEEISQKIMTDMERGATLINAQGAFSGSDKKIIFTNISIREVATIRRYIRHIDPTAFVTVIDANEVIGYGFKNIHEKY
jgi:uncharacterized membrane-anchored protein YitT (DUF2179 family)